MTTKSYGEVFWDCNKFVYDKEWNDLEDRDKKTLDDAAQEVIKEFCKRNGEAVAYVARKYGASCVGWYKSALPPDGTQLFLAPQPKEVVLPSVEELKAVVYPEKYLEENPSECDLAMSMVLELLKEKNKETVDE